MGRNAGGGGRGGSFTTSGGGTVGVGSTVYPKGNSAFRSTVTRFTGRNTAEVRLDVGARAGETFTAFLDTLAITPRR